MWTQRDAADFVPAQIRGTDDPAPNKTTAWLNWLPHLMVLGGIVLMWVTR